MLFLINHGNCLLRKKFLRNKSIQENDTKCNHLAQIDMEDKRVFENEAQAKANTKLWLEKLVLFF